MEKMYKDSIQIKLDELPKDINQSVSDACARILIAATTDNGKAVNPNIAFGGLQKAVSMFIAKFFDESKHEHLIEEFNAMLIYNVKEWVENRKHGSA
jgi:hypothetical protein